MFARVGKGGGEWDVCCEKDEKRLSCLARDWKIEDEEKAHTKRQ